MSHEPNNDTLGVFGIGLILVVMAIVFANSYILVMGNTWIVASLIIHAAHRP